MSVQPALHARPAERQLHWERGYRCHGLWDESNRRVGVVGIGPRGIWKPDDGYGWQVDTPRQEGRAPTLDQAKQEIEIRVSEKLASAAAVKRSRKPRTKPANKAAISRLLAKSGVMRSRSSANQAIRGWHDTFEGFVVYGGDGGSTEVKWRLGNIGAARNVAGRQVAGLQKAKVVLEQAGFIVTYLPTAPDGPWPILQVCVGK